MDAGDSMPAEAFAELQEVASQAGHLGVKVNIAAALRAGMDAAAVRSQVMDALAGRAPTSAPRRGDASAEGGIVAIARRQAGAKDPQGTDGSVLVAKARREAAAAIQRRAGGAVADPGQGSLVAAARRVAAQALN